MNRPAVSTARHIIMASAVLLGAVACSQDAGDSEPSKTSAAASTAASGGAPAVSEMPSCSEVAQAVGAPLTSMELMPSDKPEKFEDTNAYGLNCTWGTAEAVGVARGEKARDIADIEIMAKIGTITAQISVADNALEEADVRSANMVFDDQRVADVGGWIMAPPNLDLGGTLSPVPPQINVGKTTVFFGGSTATLRNVPEVGSITNDWAINASVAVHRLLQRRD